MDTNIFLIQLSASVTGLMKAKLRKNSFSINYKTKMSSVLLDAPLVSVSIYFFIQKRETKIFGTWS